MIEDEQINELILLAEREWNPFIPVSRGEMAFPIEAMKALVAEVRSLRAQLARFTALAASKDVTAVYRAALAGMEVKERLEWRSILPVGHTFTFDGAWTTCSCGAKASDPFGMAHNEGEAHAHPV